MERLYSILRIIFIWALVLMNAEGLGAASPVTQPEQDVWPQAPQAYKFNEVRMPTPDLATGAVNLSIPLYTIQAEDLSIPLELRYRSNGIRVDDDPYPVGYGWTFTPSLRVTRTVLGRPDGKYEFVGDRSPSDINHATAHRCMVNKSFLGKSTGLDAERDIFTINLASISFNGILEDGVISTPGHEEYKVKAASDLSSITVTDPTGNIWTYSEIGAKWMTEDPVEWGLSSIKLPSGRLLQFTWTYGMHGPTGGGAYHSYDIFYSYSLGTSCNYDSWNGDRNIQQSPSGISLNLTKVTFPGGSVSLSYTGGKTAEFLKTITLQDSSGREVRKIIFAYGDSRVDKKMLTSVSFRSGEKWSFDYNPETFTANDSQDYWGYYNRGTRGRSSAPAMRLTGLETSYNQVHIPGSDRSPSERYMKARILTGVTYPTGGKLALDYEAHRFEQEDFADDGSIIVPGDPKLYFGGGLRLSSMTLSEGSDDTTPQRVEYRYGTNGNGLANADALPVASTFLNKGIFIAEPPWSGNSSTESRPPTVKHGMISANLHSCISDYRFGEDLIWYPEVTEIYPEGKRVHRFDKPEPNNVNLEYMGGAVPVTLNSVFASSIYETEALTYSGVDGNYRLVEKEENSYSGVTEGTGSSGLLIRRKEMQGLGAPTAPDFDESLQVLTILYNGMEQNSVSYSYNEGQIYSVNSYYISPTVIRLDERIVTTYTAEGDSILDCEEYEYVRGTGLMHAKTVSRGGHDSLRTEYSYTEGQAQATATAMKTANVVGVVTGVKERFGDCSWETRADYTRVGTASSSLFRTQGIRTRRGTDASAWHTLKTYTWNDKSGTDADDKIFGTLASATDPAGIKTEWTWDDTGLYPVKQKTGHLVSQAEWKPLVGVKSLTDPSGLKEEYTYDPAGRLSSVSLNGRKMTTHNYLIHSIGPGIPNCVITSKYLDASKFIGSTTIFDGLGRAKLDATMQTSGASAVLTEYDCMGRPSKVWAAAPVSDLSPTESETKSAAVSRYGTSNAFATTTYEASPRSLVLATTKAGDPWQSEGRSVTTRIRTNTYESGERFCMSYRILEDGLRQNGPRTAGTFRIERTVDEDGIVTETFTDMRGLKVAERHGEGVTAYVYDDYGDLRYILPPGAETGGSRSSATMKELAYWFDYDAYGRCVLRKAPGMAEERMVYDPADRMVAMHSRDHADGVWRLFFYDGCGREVMVLDAAIPDAEAMSLGNACHTATFKGPEGEVHDFTVSPALEINLSNTEVVTQRFYDTYYFREALGLKDYGFKPLGVEYGSSIGKQTGLFNGEGYEVYYYNPWGLECQRVSSGFNVGRRTTKYNYDLSVSEVHTTYNGLYPDRDVYYSYDDCGRKTQMLVTEHRTRDGVAHTDSATIKYEYGPTGLLEAVVMGPSRKKITYDIHGWQLKAETELKGYGGNYIERLYYADTEAEYPRYNGFVSRKEWQKHAYDYEYDPNGFLTDATYSELPGNTQATGANQGVKFDRSVTFDYDLRGNVTMIRRKGAVDRHPSGRLTFGLLDNLKATYTGNRLTGYSYQSGIPDATFGRNRVSGITELYDRREDFSGSLTDISDDSFTVNYKLGYDASGRLTGDTSRGVRDAQYDNNGYLTEVTVGGCSVKYRRDGFGNLLRAEYSTPDGSGKDVKGDMSDRYVLYDGDGHMAVNGTLEMSRFEGGYFDADGNPHYYLTDYQGNVVRVIDETGLGGQPMDYYPYGEPWQEWDWTLADTYPTFNKNRFLYGGKERITQFGLSLYNFEARMYRAPLGRFSTPDKKAIDTPWLSPFAYCACNPVNFTDPTGMAVNCLSFTGSPEPDINKYADVIKTDLEKITGLDLSFDEDGYLQYSKNGNGDANITVRTDSNGKSYESGSSTARKFLTQMIDSPESVSIFYSPKKSMGGDNQVGIKPDQVNEFINGASKNLDGNTLGFGMVVLHEMYHTSLGGGYKHSEYLEQDMVLKNMNMIRAEMNRQGYVFGQRLSYAAKDIYGRVYLPFDDNSARSLMNDIPPNSKNLFISIKSGNFLF